MDRGKTLTTKDGFTLIELMIVVTIIGVLASLAAANFLSYQCQVKMSEAKSNLAALRKNQEAYFAEYDSYCTSLDKIGFLTKGERRYTYSITAADTTSFTAQASAIIGVEQDLWTMDQDGNLNHVSNACD